MNEKLDATPEETPEHEGRQTDMQLIMIKPVHVIEADSHRITITGHDGTVFYSGEPFPLNELAVAKSDAGTILVAFSDPKAPLKREAVYKLVDMTANELSEDDPVMK